MIIGVDIDGVLANLIVPFLKFHNRKYKTSDIPANHISNDLTIIWKCSKEEAHRRVFEFYMSSDFEKIKPVEGAVEGINRLGKKHKLHAITARPPIMQRKTDLWINQYFHKKFEIIHHTNLFSLEGAKKNKSQVCQELGIKTIIEDDLNYALDCANLDINVYLLDSPWNKTKKLPKNIIRVFGWRDITKKFDLP